MHAYSVTFFVLPFFFHSYKIGLSLEERKGNKDLRECFILGLQAIEVTERKKLFFFSSQIPGKGV